MVGQSANAIASLNKNTHNGDTPMTMNTQTLFSLQGRTAIITGGSRGIGRMIAEGFVRQGARVYITARKADACTQTAQELSQLGHCVALPLDVSTIKGAHALLAQYRQHESTLDILVNNAGAAWGADFDEFPEAGWDKVVDLNMKAPFFLTQTLAPLLRAAAAKTPRDQHMAKVINVASIDGISVNLWQTYSYSASKAGLIHLTRRMALELIKDNIAVNAIAPGAFASEMNREARDHADTVSERVPAQRVGDSSDMAAAAIYLASRASNYVVGHTLVVDGGMTHVRGQA
jgi:NAD(P)-dependent dehydrogenase (short-subunit alcohol dehydrogenase family)